MRKTSKVFVWLLGAVIMCASAARPAEAIPITWSASGSGGDGHLYAEADFTISAGGQIVVKITNLLNPAIIKSAGQAVSDLSFTISNDPGTNTSNTANGNLVTVNKDGSVTSATGTPGRWVNLESGLGNFNINGKIITLEAIGGGKPTELILPADGGGGYPSSNSSINQNFSPFVDGPATFTLNLSGVTSQTTITAVTFSFGTSPDTFLTGVPGLLPPPAPEPGTLFLLGSGLCGLAAWRRRWSK
ncbi:MAG: PEP-CTERM sorting domain-containing protein [Candidatus Binatia bacterium]